MNLVTGFIETAHAAGVVGTEITVFESLATKFAERFLAALLIPGRDRSRRSLGDAIRATRLALLRELNPLGLVYIPFALATLRFTSGQTAS